MRDDTSGWHGAQNTSGFGCPQRVLNLTTPTPGHRYHTYGSVLITNAITGDQWSAAIPNSPELIAS
jgi:hypothetical protein